MVGGMVGMGFGGGSEDGGGRGVVGGGGRVVVDAMGLRSREGIERGHGTGRVGWYYGVGWGGWAGGLN